MVDTKKVVRLGVVLVALSLAVFFVTNSIGRPAGPPDGSFKHAEPKLYMERQAGTSGDTVVKEARLVPDKGYMIDTSYHQPAPVRFAGGDRDAADSPLKATDIPAGVYLQPGG